MPKKKVASKDLDARPAEPPGAFASRASLDPLYARGYPYLRILTDEVVPPKTAAREAKKGLEAIDPYFSVEIPRAIATRYLRGYPFEPFDQTAQIVAAVQNDPPVDAALLAEVLEKKIAPTATRSYGGETYDFRLDEIVFLFEAFLGTELVASTLVEHLVRARENPAWWGSSVDHDHTDVQRIAVSLGWLRLRMERERWASIVAPLRGEQAALPRYVKRLRVLYDDTAAESYARYWTAIAIQRRDRAFLDGELVRWKEGYWEDPQLYFVLGSERLLGVPTKSLPKLPKWQQLRVLEEFGTIRAPGVVRVVAALLESRSSGAQARAWLEAHRAFVEQEALPALEKGDPTTVAAVKAALSGAVPPPKASKKDLERERKALYAGLGGELRAQAGDAKKERAVLDRVFARYCEIQAALGEVTPEAYFTHRLADVVGGWKVDEATSKRWIDLAVDAADAG